MKSGDFDTLPLRRMAESSDQGGKKPKVLPVTYEEWEPYSRALLDLLGNEEFAGSPEEIEGQKKLAQKMSTPEGLQEIISDLEAKASKHEDKPIDPQFEDLSTLDKINKLFQDLTQ